jgi:prepilin-type N-terminal cleavage/methylation domain-containing protein
MKNRNTSIGFSLFELLITIAIISIVSAIAVPAYQGYISTANMTRVAANFEESIRIAQSTMTKDESRLSMGLTAKSPNDTNGWIALFNSSGAEAPGGGPAYIPSSNNKKDRGDATTGAVGVEWRAAKAAKKGKKGKKDKKSKSARLRIWRPLYLTLVEQRATIEDGEIEIKIQRKP